MISIDASVLTAIVSVLSLLIVAVGGAYWLGRLSNRVDRLEERVEQLDGKVDRLDAKFDQQFIELREEMHQLDAKFDRRFNELRNELLEEMRRGNQQLLLTLANHRHDADGDPVFRVPVAAE